MQQQTYDEIDFDVATDYTVESQNFMLSLSKEFNNILFEQMERESNMIIASLEAAEIIFEAEQPAPAQGQESPAKQGIFQKIIAFLKRIFTIFTNKTQAMIEKNDEWLKANGANLEKVDYGGLEIEMLPFWQLDSTKSEAEAKKLSDKVANILKSKQQTEKNTDMKAVTDNLFKEYLDENGDMTNGIKNLYRTGKAKGPLQAVKLKEGALKEQATKEFLNYCLNYGKIIVPAIKNLNAAAQKQLSMIETTLKGRPAPAAAPAPAAPKTAVTPAGTTAVVKDSFCLIENAFYSDTELAQLHDFVTEAEQPAQNQQQAAAPANKDEKVSATKVQIVDRGSTQGTQAQEKLDGLSTQQLQFLKNVASITQTNVSTFMTVSEEKYIAYMNAMKQIISARSKQLAATNKVEIKPTAAGKGKAGKAPNQVAGSNVEAEQKKTVGAKLKDGARNLVNRVKGKK